MNCDIMLTIAVLTGAIVGGGLVILADWWDQR